MSKQSKPELTKTETVFDKAIVEMRRIWNRKRTAQEIEAIEDDVFDHCIDEVCEDHKIELTDEEREDVLIQLQDARDEAANKLDEEHEFDQDESDAYGDDN